MFVQVCEKLGADGLIYQNVDDLIAIGKSMNKSIETFDAACFDGHYVTGDITDAYLKTLEDKGRGSGRTRAGERSNPAQPAKATTVVAAMAAAVAAPSKAAPAKAA